MNLDGLLRHAALAQYPRGLAQWIKRRTLGGGAEKDAAYIAWNGADAAAKPAPSVYARGRYYHTVQITALDGTDILKVQVSLDGATFVDKLVTNVTTGGAAAVNMAANGVYEFAGAYDAIQVARVSGTGVATKAVYQGQAS